MTHRLADFEGHAPIRVVRDGVFSVTGKLSTPLDGLCVPLRSAAYAAAVNENSRISAVITSPELVELLDTRLGIAVAERPDDAHAEVHEICARITNEEVRQQPNNIHPTARIDPLASIAPYGVTIGKDVVVEAFVRISPRTIVEEGCILNSGVVLGTPGFNTGMIRGRQRVFPQVGGVHLKKNVELLANVSVARALFGGNTVLEEEVCIDALTYVAHDVVIGRRVLVCALSTILGRVEIGEGAYIGPSSTIMNGVRVGVGCKVSMGAVVTRDVSDGERVTGNFAIPHSAFLAHLRGIRQG